MPAHIEGVMPNPHEALTEADRLRRTSAKSLTAAREDALPQITAIRNLTCLPSCRKKVNAESRPGRGLRSGERIG